MVGAVIAGQVEDAGRGAGLLVSSAERRRPIIVVLGMHRSGTSLCAHILSALGVDMADQIGVDRGNEAGHWERWELVGFHDRILAHLNRGYFEPYHDFPLPAGWWADPAIRAIRLEMEAFLQGRMHARELFGFKDPRTVRLLPVWTQIFSNLGLDPKFVVCIRNPSQVARSLYDRDQLPRATGEYRWLVYNVDCFWGLHGEHVVIDFDDWFTNRRENLSRLHDFVARQAGQAGLQRVEDLLDIVDERLRHDAPGSQAAARRAMAYFYDLVRDPEGGAEAKSKIGIFVEQFRLFQQLLPFESSLRTLQGTVAERTHGLAAAQAATEACIRERDEAAARHAAEIAAAHAREQALSEEAVRNAGIEAELRARLAAAEAATAVLQTDEAELRARLAAAEAATAGLQADYEQRLAHEVGAARAEAAQAQESVVRAETEAARLQALLGAGAAAPEQPPES